MADPKCAECSTPFTPKRSTRLFCSDACRKSFHNAMAARGAVLTPLVLTWRRGKRGASDNSTWAMRELCALSDRWNAEDTAQGRQTEVIMTAKRERSVGWTAISYEPPL